MSFDAAPNRDMLLHELAEQMVRGLLTVLTNNIESVRSQIVKNGNAAFVYGGRPRRETQEALSLPEEIYFTVVLDQPHPGKESAAAFIAVREGGEDPGTNEALVIQILDPSSRFLAMADIRYVQHLLELIIRNADILVHEMTHLLDHHRGDRFLASSRWASREIPVSRAEYINSPVEFNAHFIGAMTELRAWWNDVSVSTRRRSTASFAAFVKRFANTVQGQALMESRRERWIRKRDVRLWQLYEVLRTRVKEDW